MPDMTWDELPGLLGDTRNDMPGLLRAAFNGQSSGQRSGQWKDMLGL